jgi:hypothetical protein
VAVHQPELADTQHLLVIHSEVDLAPQDWSRIKAAKAALNLDFTVQPVKWVPGSPGRVLAIGSEPSGLWEGAFIKDTTTPNLIDALRIVLTDAVDPRMMTWERWLNNQMGPGVTEVVEPVEDYGTRGQFDPNASDGIRAPR